jgi:hypothetical protein
MPTKASANCSRCGVTKTRENTRWRAGLGKFRPRCRKCERADFRDAVDAMSPTARREFFAARNAGQKQSIGRATRAWERTHKLARRAQRMVHRALARGVLVKPPTCAWCKRGDAPRLCAHHADYARPLDVEFICDRCHRQHHRQEAA